MNAMRNNCWQRRSGLVPILATAALTVGCGGGHIPPPTVTGIAVQPSVASVYSSDAPPKNQVSFAAYITYSDASQSPNPISNVKWTYDSASWVSLNGNVATCLQPAPVIIFPFGSTITATAPVNGTTYTVNAGLVCL